MRAQVLLWELQAVPLKHTVLPPWTLLPQGWPTPGAGMHVVLAPAEEPWRQNRSPPQPTSGFVERLQACPWVAWVSALSSRQVQVLRSQKLPS